MKDGKSKHAAWLSAAVCLAGMFVLCGRMNGISCVHAEDGRTMEETDLETPDAAETEPSAKDEEESFALPSFSAEGYVWKQLTDEVALQVPDGWFCRESSETVMSYSPVSESGALSPSAGTLQIAAVKERNQTAESTLDEYEENLSRMNSTSGFSSEETEAAGQTARKIHYQMTLGANRFDCEIVCFMVDDVLYSIGMMQGEESSFDYFSVLDEAVESLQVKNNLQIQTAVRRQPASSYVVERDLGSFRYSINGHIYQFPTAVSDLTEGDLPLDSSDELPFEAEDPDGESREELADSVYFTYVSSLYQEMIGVTNLSGTAAEMQEGMVTLLEDTKGEVIQVTLPGGLTVGSSESDIPEFFPEFAGREMDGSVSFREDELLYTCSVRDDGCDEYLLIKKDPPFYSALTILCDNGEIREISFECLGKNRAAGLFE